MIFNWKKSDKFFKFLIRGGKNTYFISKGLETKIGFDAVFSVQSSKTTRNKPVLSMVNPII